MLVLKFIKAPRAERTLFVFLIMMKVQVAFARKPRSCLQRHPSSEFIFVIA